MKTALCIGLLSLSVCLPAHAYELQTGSVMICETQRQAERFAELFDGNHSVATRAVNSEENNPMACATLELSYVPGPKQGMARSRSHAFQIIPIVVVGIHTPDGSASVAPRVFFTVVEVKEF